jgi:hypothetical protein
MPPRSPISWVVHDAAPASSEDHGRACSTKPDSALVALCLALYVLLDIADSGHLDGSIARHALSLIFGTHP